MNDAIYWLEENKGRATSRTPSSLKHLNVLGKNGKTWTSLMVPWLRIYFAMQGTRVRSLLRELRFHVPWSN